MLFTEQDQQYMQRALELARCAEAAGEVPVGAVLVKDQQIIGEGFNQPIVHHDASAHAEIMAMRAASQKLNNYRLLETTLYVTLEPCMMCAAAMVHARIARLVFGAFDPKTGACGSVWNFLAEKNINHKVNFAGGLLADECGELLRVFFRKKR